MFRASSLPIIRSFLLSFGTGKFKAGFCWLFPSRVIPNLFCYKTLQVSGIFSAHHQEFSTVQFGTGKFHAVFWWPFPSRVIPNLFFYKTLHVSGIFSAHHQEFSTVHSALVSFMQVFDDRFQAESFQIYSVIKLYMFRASSLPIIRSFLLYIRHW